MTLNRKVGPFYAEDALAGIQFLLRGSAAEKVSLERSSKQVQHPISTANGKKRINAKMFFLRYQKCLKKSRFLLTVLLR
jgi:hypothetical protein